MFSIHHQHRSARKPPTSDRTAVTFPPTQAPGCTLPHMTDTNMDLTVTHKAVPHDLETPHTRIHSPTIPSYMPFKDWGQSIFQWEGEPGPWAHPHFCIFTPNQQACIAPAKTQRSNLFIQFAPEHSFRLQFISHLRLALIFRLFRPATTHALRSTQQNLSKTLAHSPPSSQQSHATHTTTSADRNHAMASSGASPAHHGAIAPLDLAIHRHAPCPHPPSPTPQICDRELTREVPVLTATVRCAE